MNGPGWTCACGTSGLGGVSCVHCGLDAWWFVPASAPPPRAGLDRRGKVLAALIALLAFTGTLRVSNVVATERAEHRAAVAATVRELMAFVAAERGAPFLRPVRADLLGDKAFRRAMADDGDPGETEEDDFGATMLGLGLAGAEDDPSAADDALTDGVVGFYDTADERLYVRGREMTPYARLVLVHELAHAWQDQHYDLDGLDWGPDADSRLAVEALVEGDAMRVERRWRERQSAADRAAIDAVENAGGDESDEPTRAEVSLSVLYAFPYGAGEPFAEAIADDGGNGAIERAFRNPPRTTEQVLHPEKYFAAEPAVRVSAPDPDDDVVDKGVLGELGLLLVVLQGRWDDGARDVVAGWAGDGYVTWDTGSRLCTEATVRMDTAAARNRLAAALRASSGEDRSVVETGRTGVELRYCATY